MVAIAITATAQQPAIQYFRPNDKKGLNVFETTKSDTTVYTGMKVRIGGNFTQNFQALAHENNATPVYVNGINTKGLCKNNLYILPCSFTFSLRCISL